MASHHYRGYEIRVSPNGHGWRVSATPLSAELPIMGQYSFWVNADSEDEALTGARQYIDECCNFNKADLFRTPI